MRYHAVRRSPLLLRAFLSCVLSLAGANVATAAEHTYPTFHADLARDGWNAGETHLSQANVARLRRVAAVRLDGEADAQPLYAHGTFYVATERNTLYAIDPVRGVRWRVRTGMPVPASGYRGCRAPAPVIGLASTPVIDEAADALYAVDDEVAHGRPQYVLRAFALRDGRELRRAVLAAAGNAAVESQRAGLALANGTVYVAFASFCDANPAAAYGRVLGYDARTFALRAAFTTTASPRCGGVHLGGVWGMGFAPAVDGAGHVYVSTGNGCIDDANARGGAFADSVLRLDARLRMHDAREGHFAPCDALRENAHDQELGSGGVVLVPDTRLLLAGGKTGVTYVLARDDLGGRTARCPDRVPFERDTNDGLWGGPVVWRSAGTTFAAVAGDGPAGARIFALDPRTARLALRSQTNESLRNGGASLAVTSNGATHPRSVLLWLATRPDTGTVFLRAYDPLRATRPLVSVAAGTWSNASGYAALSPTVVDGYAALASDRVFTAWRADAADALRSARP